MRHIFAANYAAHASFVRPARGASQIWRLGAGCALIVVGQFVLLPGFWALLGWVLSDEAYTAVFVDLDSLLLPQSALILLYSFAAVWVLVALAARVFHRRNPLSLIGPAGTFARQVRVCAGWLIGLNAIVFAVLWATSGPLLEGLPLGKWLLFLGPALLGVLIQTSAEEVMFRGYLQQQLAARFNASWVWMVVPSVLFGLLHYQPVDYGANAWLIVLWATLFGMIAADLTARSGSLGPAIALHFANNVAALVIVAPQGALSGLALFQYGFSTSDVEAVRAYLPVDLAVMLCSWLALRLALKR